MHELPDHDTFGRMSQLSTNHEYKDTRTGATMNVVSPWGMNTVTVKITDRKGESQQMEISKDALREIAR